MSLYQGKGIKPTTLYIAVTPDELELPLYVTDSPQAMASWAGIGVQSVHQQCSRNKKKAPFNRQNGGRIHSPHRLRKIIIEEENP